VLAAGLGGCMETGDFGRVKHSTWNDMVLGGGAASAHARQAPVSAFPFTDDEDEMRGRAWRFLTPAQERAYVDQVVAQLVATRIVPPTMFAPDITAYHGALVSVGAVSPANRYRRLSEDMMADAHLLEPFARNAARVLSADRVRLRALAYTHELAPSDIANAEARVAENRCVIAWVKSGLAWRQRQYRFSLEHLVIETPQGDAVPVERAMALLGQAGRVLDRLGVSPLEGAACAGQDAPVPPAALLDGPPPPAPPLPLVRKG
jgi:hypothetical protein